LSYQPPICRNRDKAVDFPTQKIEKGVSAYPNWFNAYEHEVQVEHEPVQVCPSPS